MSNFTLVVMRIALGTCRKERGVDGIGERYIDI